MAYDLEAEYGAVKSYRNFAGICHDLGDVGTKEMLDGILKDEEDHVDWLEAQKDQIAQMGSRIISRDKFDSGRGDI